MPFANCRSAFPGDGQTMRLSLVLGFVYFVSDLLLTLTRRCREGDGAAHHSGFV